MTGVFAGVKDKKHKHKRKISQLPCEGDKPVLVTEANVARVFDLRLVENEQNPVVGVGDGQVVEANPHEPVSVVFYSDAYRGHRVTIAPVDSAKVVSDSE